MENYDPTDFPNRNSVTFADDVSGTLKSGTPAGTARTPKSRWRNNYFGSTNNKCSAPTTENINDVLVGDAEYDKRATPPSYKNSRSIKRGGKRTFANLIGIYNKSRISWDEKQHETHLTWSPDANGGGVIGASSCGATTPDNSMSPTARDNNSVVFFDIACGGKHIGRVYFELFDKICPKTCENFRLLCLGTAGMSSTGTPLHYKGTRFFRIIQNFLIQGGDVTHDNGSGGECVWANKRGGRSSKFFADEGFTLSHSAAGILSMANCGPHTNQSQFFVTCAPLPWLDGINVVFGKVIKGFSTLAALEGLGSLTGAVHCDVRVTDCGDAKGQFEMTSSIISSVGPQSREDSALVNEQQIDIEDSSSFTQLGLVLPVKTSARQS